MVYASSDLREAHVSVLAGLDVLEKMAASKEASVEDARELAEFISQFADKCHHGKEEGLMFPAMEKMGIQRERGPIGQMLLEHVQGRAYIAALKAAAAGQTLNRAAFREAAEGYVYLMRAHIDKENGVLFQMGDRLLPAEEQARLLKAFEEHEQKVMGPGAHEHLHDILHRLSKKYL